jgi:CO/xanthine dehydrogenase Mo-binding subunit
VGEVPIVPPLAAIANAIADATGHRFTDLPMSPRHVLEALNGVE